MEILLVIIAVVICVGLPMFLVLYPLLKGVDKSKQKAAEKAVKKEQEKKNDVIKMLKNIGVSASEEQLLELSVKELYFLYFKAKDKKEENRKEELLKLI